MDLPNLDTIRDGVQDATAKAKQHGRVLIPWLPSPPDCPECGEMMYADYTYAPRQACYVSSWDCRACGTATHRDPVYEHEAPQPTTGSRKLREALRGQP